MRLNQIRDFISVIEAGSIRAAARRLGVSQPAMTKSIRKLEDELHVQLVQRTTRGVAATRAGKAYLARARVIQAEARKAEEELAQIAGGPVGSMAFGVPSPTVILVLPEALEQFRRQHPVAPVRVIEGQPHALLPLVRDETLDFCVGAKLQEALDAGVRFRPLLRTRLVVACRPGHPLRGARSLRELAHASWLVFVPAGSGGLVQKAFESAAIAIRGPTVHCESFGGVLGLLAKTDSLTMLPHPVLADPFARTILQEIAVKEALPALTIGLYTRADTPLTPVAAAMARAVSAALRRLTGSA